MDDMAEDEMNNQQEIFDMFANKAAEDEDELLAELDELMAEDQMNDMDAGMPMSNIIPSCAAIPQPVNLSSS